VLWNCRGAPEGLRGHARGGLGGGCSACSSVRDSILVITIFIHKSSPQRRQLWTLLVHKQGLLQNQKQETQMPVTLRATDVP